MGTVKAQFHNIITISHSDSSMISNIMESSHLFERWFSPRTKLDTKEKIEKWFRRNLGIRKDVPISNCVRAIDANTVEIRVFHDDIPPTFGLERLSEKFGFQIVAYFDGTQREDDWLISECGEYSSSNGDVKQYEYGYELNNGVPAHLMRMFPHIERFIQMPRELALGNW